MKLLFFSNTLQGGGAERVLANITKELSRQGHNITIALNINKIDYEIADNIEIIYSSKNNWYNGKNIFKRICRNISMKIHYYKHTKNAILKVKPDIIITFLRCNMIPIIRLHNKIPIISSEHNAYDRKIGFIKSFERFILNRYFDKVCVLTSFDQGYARAKGLTNTVVMPNPNTFDSISIEDYDRYFPKRKNILVCGRVFAWQIKGFDIAIEAFAKIANKIPNTDLDIVGDGDEKSINHLKQIATKYGVHDRVHFLGKSNNIINIMREHKIFVLSSRTEGFPMVITEAMSQGLPCISFERLSSPIIINNIDGVLVNNGNVEELSNAIVKLISNNELRYNLGKESIKNVNRFSAENVVKRWENIFNN